MIRRRRYLFHPRAAFSGIEKEGGYFRIQENLDPIESNCGFLIYRRPLDEAIQSFSIF